MKDWYFLRGVSVVLACYLLAGITLRSVVAAVLLSISFYPYAKT